MDKVRISDNLVNIYIKLNLNDYRGWKTASTCDPFLLDSLLSVLANSLPNSDVTIIENNATGVNADNIFDYRGIKQIANKYDCKCIYVATES